MRRSCSRYVVFAVLVLGLLGALRGVSQAALPLPVGYPDEDRWNAIRTPRICDDGRYLAYALTPDYGDPTLVVRDLVTGAERREARGTAPQFTAVARSSSLRSCRRKPRSMPPDGPKNRLPSSPKTDSACSNSRPAGARGSSA